VVGAVLAGSGLGAVVGPATGLPSGEFPGAAAMRTIGLSHLALNTADLDRFRRFYEGLLGLRVGVVLRMSHPPYLRHATFHIDDVVVLHVFELPGYDPQATGIGTGMGERGRVDHFGFMVRDEVELRAVADRLRAAGATDGEIRRLGPVLSVRVTDPDGLEVEVNCPDLEFELVDGAGEEIEEIGLPDWLERVRAAVLVAPTWPS
jgi:catechol 2,3-dioxygenase-like lactoylglutathione lyase family enzyme